eukprot:766748-Hanusia_phi.AAC.2
MAIAKEESDVGERDVGTAELLSDRVHSQYAHVRVETEGDLIDTTGNKSSRVQGTAIPGECQHVRLVDRQSESPTLTLTLIRRGQQYLILEGARFGRRRVEEQEKHGHALVVVSVVSVQELPPALEHNTIRGGDRCRAVRALQVHLYSARGGDSRHPVLHSGRIVGENVRYRLPVPYATRTLTPRKEPLPGLTVHCKLLSENQRMDRHSVEPTWAVRSGLVENFSPTIVMSPPTSKRICSCELQDLTSGGGRYVNVRLVGAFWIPTTVRDGLRSEHDCTSVQLPVVHAMDVSEMEWIEEQGTLPIFPTSPSLNPKLYPVRVTSRPPVVGPMLGSSPCRRGASEAVGASEPAHELGCERRVRDPLHLLVLRPQEDGGREVIVAEAAADSCDGRQDVGRSVRRIDEADLRLLDEDEVGHIRGSAMAGV